MNSVTLRRRVGEKLTLAIGPYRIELEIVQAQDDTTTITLDKLTSTARIESLKVKPNPNAVRKLSVW